MSGNILERIESDRLVTRRFDSQEVRSRERSEVFSEGRKSQRIDTVTDTTRLFEYRPYSPEVRWRDLQ